MTQAFKGIFRRHFFSNHHVESKRVESFFQNHYPQHECVTFNSFENLTIACIDECIQSSQQFHISSMVSGLYAIKNLCVITRRILPNELNHEMLIRLVSNKKTNSPFLEYVRGVITSETRVLAFLIDFANIHPLLRSGALLVTDQSETAEKIRWARSSYGRTADSSVNIAANGRFSEFQGVLANVIARSITDEDRSI